MPVMKCVSSQVKQVLFLLLAVILTSSCGRTSHQDMIDILKDKQAKYDDPVNSYSPASQLKYYSNLLKAIDGDRQIPLQCLRASLLIKVGKEQDAVSIYEHEINRVPLAIKKDLLPEMAIAYMRLGERNNCMLNHNGSSCIFPIKDGGVHLVKTGSIKAIEVYEQILKADPNDLESRWLLNIAFMTLGKYPESVPPQFLIPGLDSDEGIKVKPFKDMATDLGLDINAMAGGVIADDFNNDGYLDIITSGWMIGDSMHYFQSNKDGTFTNVTTKSNLAGITGGLNIQQTDYNNDGKLDIFILRGAWNGSKFGSQPNSLLRNNGDGTFTDVTTKSGLLLFEPTQAAVWADFNNDGWLDVFVGAESTDSVSHPCALFINNHNGSFTDIAKKAHCDIKAFIKGVTAADYNKDGWTDIYISCIGQHGYLLKNEGKTGMNVKFEDVSSSAGFTDNKSATFGTWFFDYDNDGWPDIMAADYNFYKSKKNLGYFAAAKALNKPVPGAGNIYLYKNNHDGTFTNTTKEAGLDKVVFAMGCNFGDIDNDGYLDMYFGTGNPNLKSLIPNKLFKNINGKKFVDVTTSARIGTLQKGHAIAFADFRNIGKQDIFSKTGGAFSGDAYTSSLYVNPGQNNNNWISLKLEGVKANKQAIGSHIKLTFTENGVKRSVYKDLNSGGSFGSSPLRQEIGIGQATSISEIEIQWAGTNKVQLFKNIAPNQFLHITEGNKKPEVIKLAKLSYKAKPGIAVCKPMETMAAN
ncbi:MAG: hypothetical protein JWP67_809 [Mucilaginibacter sp.]|nr:hypothetical protein [Mucilaginibacter sp.]